MIKIVNKIFIIIIPFLFIFTPSALSQSNSFENKSTEGPDTLINYNASNIRIIPKKGGDIVVLAGKAWVKYRKATLEADTIKLDVAKNIVYATYSLDTIYTDESKTEIDTIMVKGLPTLKEGNSEPVYGNSMVYNLETKEGKVEHSRTKVPTESSEHYTYVSAHRIIKRENNVINGIDGAFTSCELEEPDYHFEADSMIMDTDDWLYAKGITLKFGKVPVGWFPYILYKNVRGRRSGFILPSYDYSSGKGNGLEHLGYFWDISRYMDYTVLADYYDYYGYILEQKFRYRLRYILEGDLNARFVNTHSSKEWRLWGFHNHIITPTTKFRSSFDYVTKGDLVRDTGDTPQERMQNVLNSSAQFDKRWNDTGDYLRLTTSYTQYVDTNIVKYKFPDFSYNMTKRKPFATNKDLPSILRSFKIGSTLKYKKNVDKNDDLDIFTDNTDYSVKFSESMDYEDFTLSSTQTFVGDIYDARKQRFFTEDTLTTETRVDTTDSRYALNTDYSFSYNHKLFKYINFKESINLSHDISGQEYNPLTKELEDKVIHRTTYNASISTDTKIFGMFEPDLWRLLKLRHSIYPSATLTYTPDFSEKKFGYYSTYTDSTGTYDYDRFSKTLSGSTPSAEKMVLSWSLRNLLEGKFLGYDEKEFNRDLFTLNFSGNYDFFAESQRLSDINAAFASTLYNGKLNDIVSLNLTTNANAIISPYDKGGQYLNKSFNFFERNPFRIKSRDFSYRLSLPFKKEFILSKDMFDKKSDDDEEGEDGSWNILKEKSNYTEMNFSISGNVNFSEKYTYNDSGEDYNKNFNATLRAEIEPTERWKVSYNAGFNMLRPKKITSTTISVYRDLHCWEAKFDWDIFQKGFKIMINVKSPVFRDLKYEQDTRKHRW